MKVIRTTEGFMVEKDDGDYLCDLHDDNLWDTRSEAEEAIEWAKNGDAELQLDKYPTYHDVIDAVIAQIKVDLDKQDETAIVELLGRLPRKVLLSYLPEEVTK
jgi:hypothetical protein